MEFFRGKQGESRLEVVTDLRAKEACGADACAVIALFALFKYGAQEVEVGLHGQRVSARGRGWQAPSREWALGLKNGEACFKKIPMKMGRRLWIGVLMGLVLLPLASLAQVKQFDAERRNQAFQPGSGSAFRGQKQINGRFRTLDQKQLDYPTLEYGKNRFQDERFRSSDERSRFSLDELYGVKMYDPGKKEYKYDMSRLSGKQARLENLDAFREIVMADKYRNTGSIEYDTIDNEYLRQLVDQLSMEDINRFQFRRNRSREPGFTKQKAGGDGTVME